MAFNVLEMKNRLLQFGVARPNRYIVYLTSPFGTNIEEISLRCEATTLPGKSIATTTHTIYGASREKPYNQIFETQEMTFICSEGMNEKKFFDAWLSLIIDPTSGYIGYHDDYATDIEIYQMGTDGYASYGVKLHEAFPKVISPLTLGYAENDTYHKLTISFSYLYWTRVVDPQSKNNSGLSNDLGSANIPQNNNDAGGRITANVGDQFGDAVDKALDQPIESAKSLGRYLLDKIGFNFP